MADIKWIKVATDIFEDEKMCLIDTYPDADSIFVIWFKLLALAGKQNNGGCFKLNDIPLDVPMLASIFHRSEDKVQRAIDVFQQFGMITLADETYSLVNWNKHQTLLTRTEYMKQYMREYRQKDKVVNDVNTVNFTLTDKNKEERIKNKEERSKKCVGHFVPPTVEEVASYVTSSGLNVEPAAFVDFYSAKNWMVGRNKMKDWKAAARNWSRREVKKPSPKQSGKVDEMWEKYGNE